MFVLFKMSGDNLTPNALNKIILCLIILKNTPII